MANPVIADPAAVGEILEIDVRDIDMGERLRPIDANWAAALAKIMAVEGQRTPIEVCRVPGRRGFTLVAGGHRLEAHMLMCRLLIRAIIVDADKAERRAREISENLWRKALDPVDRATFVAELYELLRVRDGIPANTKPQSLAATARWQNGIKTAADDATAKIAVAYGWDAEIGERLGLASRTIRAELTLHKRLLPGVVQLLRSHPIAKNASQLAALAKLNPDDQTAIARMIAGGVARSVADAMGMRSQKPKPDAETKRYNAVIGNLGRMGVAERQAALDQIADMYFQACRRAVAKAGGFEGDDA